jgi:hypothetical protein
MESLVRSVDTCGLDYGGACALGKKKDLQCYLQVFLCSSIFLALL